MGVNLISCQLEPSGKQNVVQQKIRHVDSSCSLSAIISLSTDSGCGQRFWLSSRTGSDKCGCIMGQDCSSLCVRVDNTPAFRLMHLYSGSSSAEDCSHVCSFWLFYVHMKSYGLENCHLNRTIQIFC